MKRFKGIMILLTGLPFFACKENENTLTLDPTGWTCDLTFMLFGRETESL